jgi:flavin reductase (DIM6/NTAB) family NADH-FMN oxidoreductase RutF
MSQPTAALFQCLTQGVYVIGVAHIETRRAFTAAWVMQVSFDPLLLALSVNPNHSCYGLLKAGRLFSVNVLKKRHLGLAEHYGRPAQADKFVSAEWTIDPSGLPHLRDALAWFACEAISEQPAGDHILVVGKVTYGDLLDSEADPMLYRETGSMDGAASLYPKSWS